MLEAGWGRIGMIAGLTGQTGASHRAHVVTAKAGLIGLTKALALEYAPHNIKVNAVSPEMIDTTRAGSVPRHYSERRVPVGRLGRPEDVAAPTDQFDGILRLRPFTREWATFASRPFTLLSSLPCSVFVPRTSAILGNTTTPHDTLKIPSEQAE
jgi:NAD(P)-dependent dehydrogenase (short-subunit alcohol dehydrogenase family)